MIGCTAKRVALVPAPSAILAAEPNSAGRSSQGLSVLLQANDWNEYPQGLDGDLVPIKVTIRNNRGRLGSLLHIGLRTRGNGGFQIQKQGVQKYLHLRRQ